MSKAKRNETCSVCGETWNVSVTLNLDDYWGFYICPACRAQLHKKEKNSGPPSRSGAGISKPIQKKGEP